MTGGRSLKYLAVTSVLLASFAIASVAHAGAYAGNVCVAKKQIALAKHASSVAKAWKKYSTDATSRNDAITASADKLAEQWDKAEASAEKKNSRCDESTSDAATAGTAVSDAIASQSGAADVIAKYTKDAMKAWGKYLKKPDKDPGKAKLNESIGKAVDKRLTGQTQAVVDTATGLESDLVALTTTAPDYPTTFKKEVPDHVVKYGKEELYPICVDGDPYVFFARKGDSNNVLMYYQGGGACWSTDSCFTAGTCKRTTGDFDDPNLWSTGFGDMNNPDNPFRDWNVVVITYCTCDVHWGDNNQYYGPGKTGRHRGRVNAMVAEKFAREHFLDPDRVFVTGSSAGSYGAIMNSYWLQKDVWPNADFSVVGDAGIGVITKDWLDTYIKNWGVDKHFPSDVPGVALPVENLSIVDLWSGMAERFPNSRFGNYDSSYDGGGGSQTQFFQAMRHPTPPASNVLEWLKYWQSACEWNACMREFKDEIRVRSSNGSDNYRLFTGAGNRHTIFGSDKVYTETNSTDAAGDGVTFADWVTAMIGNTGDWVDADCANPNGDCDHLITTCQGGDNAGLDCSSDVDCPGGGSCQKDENPGEAPYVPAPDNLVDCAPTVCPCAEVNCPTFTP